MPPRPKVLMMVPYLPAPPESGGRKRTVELLRRLRADVDVTLLCLARSRERAADVSPLRELAAVHLVAREESPTLLAAGRRALTSSRPLTVQLYRSPELRTLAARLAARESFDAIHVESFYMLQNVPEALADRVVLMEPNVESRAWSRYARVARPVLARPIVAVESLKIETFERRAWRAARLVGLVSNVDLEHVASRVPEAATFLAPNGVDLERYRPASREPDPDVALFVGDYKYFPNVDAAEHFVKAILPRVLGRRPGFRLRLAGKDPPARLRALARRRGVELLGRIEDVREALARASLFVCPLRAGSGTRLKLLEAMACGVPVVSTTVGCEGLGLERDRHLLVGDGADAFAERVLLLLDDPARAAKIARQARRWTERNGGWEEASRSLTTAYERARDASASAVSRAGTMRRQS